MEENIQNLLIRKDMTVKEVMKRMDETAKKILFVIDDDLKLLGSLTDGDVRRELLKDNELGKKISGLYNRNPIFVNKGYNFEEVKKIMLDNKIEWVPVVGDLKEVVEILLWEDVFGKDITLSKKKLNIPVLIMAGGRGARLEPFTKVLPKPLIPIGEKTIIDIIMDKFSHYGINEFYISVSHKAKMIKSYFEEINTKYIIHYLEEKVPLGTIGGLKKLCNDIKNSVLVTNCDIVVDCDYNEVVEFHSRNNYDISLVASVKHFTIPYGVCEIEKEGMLKDIIERPEHVFWVSTGMYILKKQTLDFIPEDQEFHITDLINRVKENGGRIGVFPVNEKSWLDIGQWEEYRKSVRLLRIGQ